jgi:hypothetical protein
MKDNKSQSTNPFVFADTAAPETNQRKLDHTTELIGISTSKARDLIKAVADRPDLHEQADKVITNCDFSETVNLIKAVFDDETIESDAAFMVGTDDTTFGKLLESRRSDRSKAKAKGPKKNMMVCINYLSAAYAEVLIRSAWNKPYNATNATEIDTELLASDRDALERKIKSLQSKKCRLAKTAQYVESDKIELAETEAEIDRLTALRPTSNVQAKTVIKGLDIAQIQDIMKSLDKSKLTPEQQAAYDDVMTKLG